MIKLRNVLLSSGLAFLVSAIIAAQGNRPSPPATADVTLAGKQIVIKYSRPSMRGRKIMGDIVPYGQVWRTGANEATTLITPVALRIGTASVPPGEYTLWTLPAESGWKLIINKQTGQWRWCCWGWERRHASSLHSAQLQSTQCSRCEQNKAEFNQAHEPE
ncbi:MAG TPA: DUF2911 domain-containing protein [Bryobacteraceae bacterium]|nr:DUF2911 domain-containing protein [Bryobacteraceae bacterium]